MKNLNFTKMSGAGNDFIVIDNMAGKITLNPPQISKMCARQTGIGADGIIMPERKKGYDFYMRFYNSDGSEAEMCGNASRCISRFVYLRSYAGKKIKFLAKDGPHTAQIMQGTNVKIEMTDPTPVQDGIKVTAVGKQFVGGYVNTGVPHFVIEMKKLSAADIVTPGREIRFSKKFAPKGTNVMFIEKVKDGYAIRSYERGVEGETLACGTGATAAAIVLASRRKTKSPSVFYAPGGTLKIYFENQGGSFRKVYLEGPADIVFEGKYSL